MSLPPPPTLQTSSELQGAFDHFNAALFGGDLPPCLITLQRRSPAVMGYYSKARFGSNREPGTTTDEIALNPIHFMGRDATEVLQTLVHEMCHLWQCHFGKPSRTGYHNREWAAKMVAVGLHPSSTGKPGGAIVGQHMADYVIADGHFDRAMRDLTSGDFRISWYDRIAELLVGLMVPPLVTNPSPQTPSPVSNYVAPSPLQRPGRRERYSCSGCRLKAWAKPRAKLVCGTCNLPMSPQLASPTVGRVTTREISRVNLEETVLHTTGAEHSNA
jgi:hypothetical protein